MANTNLAQTIKQQIMVRLLALKTAGWINSVAELDENPNPFKTEASNGYPLAIVAMPRVKADFEDQANDMRVMTFDILFIVRPEDLANNSDGAEAIMDAILNEFANLTELTLSGAANAAVLPLNIDSQPVSTDGKTYLCFFAKLEARTLYQVS